MIYHDHEWYSHQEVTQLGVVAHGNHKLCANVHDHKKVKDSISDSYSYVELTRGAVSMYFVIILPYYPVENNIQKTLVNWHIIHMQFQLSYMYN